MESVFDFLQNSSIFSAPIICILIGVGFFVGFVNTIAGCATAISYALFMAMGMPVNVANGTSRLGVTLQFATSSFIFNKEGYLNKRHAWQAGIPIAIGSIGGSQIASIMKPYLFEIILACFLIVMLVLLVFDAKRFITQPDLSSNKPMPFWKTLVFMVIGFYGGFTHVGVGLLVIFGSVFMLKTDLLHANAIKQFTTLLYTPLALLIFALHGQVNWPVAAIYAIGNILGGYVGSKKAIHWGANFIRWFTAGIIFIYIYDVHYDTKSSSFWEKSSRSITNKTPNN